MTPTQLEAILAEREACAEVAGKLVRFDRKNADAQQRGRADSFQSGQRYAAEQIRNRPTPASEEVDGWTGKPRDLASRQLEAIAQAFLATWYDWPDYPAEWWRSLSHDEQARARRAAASVNTLARP